jgi:peptidoglycan-N-acetylglucosamine deacetylase
VKTPRMIMLLTIAISIPAGFRGLAAQVPDKLCALTFDDGPSVTKTPLVLDRLEKYGVVATFFQVGQNINDSTKPVIDRIVKDGCEIGNHSWNYTGLNTASAERIKDLVDRTSAAIEQYSGTAPKFFRATNLAASRTMYDTVKLPFVSGVLGMDWDGCNTDAATRAQNVVLGMRDGAIILLHDVQPDPHPTPEALDILIPELKEMGYEFVTLSELFRRKGVDPSSNKNGMWQYVQ